MLAARAQRGWSEVCLIHDCYERWAKCAHYHSRDRDLSLPHVLAAFSYDFCRCFLVSIGGRRPERTSRPGRLTPRGAESSRPRGKPMLGDPKECRACAALCLVLAAVVEDAQSRRPRYRCVPTATSVRRIRFRYWSATGRSVRPTRVEVT
jgi:hypothetical protein